MEHIKIAARGLKSWQIALGTRAIGGGSGLKYHL